MDLDHRRRVKELFDAALELPEADRPAFLREACPGEDVLRQEVEALLSGQARAGSFMEKPAGMISSAETAAGSAASAVRARASEAAGPAFAPDETVSGRFRIVRLIGQGGMGEVYEARDLELGERVALKTIRAEPSLGERGLARFKNEAQLARRVTHPNVCRIFDLQHHQAPSTDPDHPSTEVTFLSMELIEGETLAERLLRVGRMSTAEALPVIDQMARALAAAHAVGVVHRDFKPGNVMLVSSSSVGAAERTVVTDFGLARAVPLHDSSPDSRTLPPLTETGQFVGTIAYMAPEQLRGGDVTPATDVYALGLVMYEMVSGKRPASPPAPVPGLDPKWQAAISRCLEYDPAKRFAGPMEAVWTLTGQAESGSPAGLIAEGSQSQPAAATLPRSPGALRAMVQHKSVIGFVAMAVAVAALISVLRHAPPTKPAASLSATAKQLAVLPFDTVGGDTRLRAFAYGLTDTLTGKLTQLTERSSLAIFPASEVRSHDITTVEEAQKEFGVNLVLTGSLQSDGKQVRVTTVLIDVKTRRQLSSETVTASLADAFAVEDQVVSHSVRMLGIEPNGKEHQVLVAHGTEQAAAYDDYLEGLGYARQSPKSESLQSAIQAFNRALRKDNGYGLAYAGLGEVYWLQYENTHDSSWVGLARAACQKSAGLGNGGAEAHICLGFLDNGTGRYTEAAEQFKRVIELEPTNDQGYRGMAEAYQKLRKFSEAEKTYQAAIALRPNYGAAYGWLGSFYFSRGRFGDAARMYKAAVNLAPDDFVWQSDLGGAYLMEGQYTEAIAPLKTSLEIRPTSYAALSNLGTAYYDLHQYSQAARTYEQATRLEPHSYDVWGNLGDAYYWAPGERGHAAPAYQKAVALAQQDLQVNPKDFVRLSYVATYEAMVGDRAEALSFLDRALRPAGKDPEILFNAALVHNQLGDTDEALDWLTKAVNLGYPINTLRDTPNFSNLQNDQRFENLLKRR